MIFGTSNTAIHTDRQAYRQADRQTSRQTAALLLFIALCAAPTNIFAQVDFDELNFQEALRSGVVRFHRGSYNEAIRLFQQSLSYSPNNFLARLWLGRAYYSAGLEDAALNEWQRILPDAPPFLSYFVDSLASRSSLAAELEEDFQYVLIEEFRQSEYGNALRNPAGVLAQNNGSIIVTSFGNNTVSVLGANGRLFTNTDGNIQTALRGPFDVDVYADQLFVANFLGDTIAIFPFETGLAEDRIQSFSRTGIDEGETVGPKFLSISPEPAVYVADIGNQRVAKFTTEGEFLFSFGEPESLRRGSASGRNFDPQAGSFAGFQNIAGITATANGLFVADNILEERISSSAEGSIIRRRGVLNFFDWSGNLLEVYPLHSLSTIEDIANGDAGELIITGRSEVYSFNPRELLLESIYAANENENVQFVSATLDANDNLVISDFRNSRVLVLSRLSGVYSGYQLEIKRIDSQNFPDIQVELSVRDFLANDIIGLARENFVFTEDMQESSASLSNIELEYSGANDRQSAVAVVLEASPREPRLVREQGRSLRRLLAELPQGSDLFVYAAAANPVLLYNSQEDDISFLQNILTRLERGEGLGAEQDWRLDAAIRLSADRLLSQLKKREILYLGSGIVPDWSFESLGLTQTMQYLRNNSIRFNAVLSNSEEISAELQYLLEQSAGNVYISNQLDSLEALRADLLERRTGTYLFSMTSSVHDGFGREYIPLQAGVFHFAKSGRDESGYFAPLRF